METYLTMIGSWTLETYLQQHSNWLSAQGYAILHNGPSDQNANRKFFGWHESQRHIESPALKGITMNWKPSLIKLK